MMRRFFQSFLATTLVGAAFVGGFTVDTLQGAPGRSPRATLGLLQTLPPALLARALQPAFARAQDTSAALEPTDTFFSVMNTIRGDYYNPQAAGETVKTAPAATKLTYAAINGMLGSIKDKYTEFWEPEEYRQNIEETKGDFVGIGAELGLTKDKKVMIIEPIDGSPAKKKGVLPGDVIVRVDDKPVVGLNIDQVIERIRGEAGTPVGLTLLRTDKDGAEKPVQFSITRAVVHSPTVKWRMFDKEAGIGYIKLSMFNEQADPQFAAALARLEGQNMKALIFDLRNNPGGLLTSAQDVASRFVDSGPVVWVKDKVRRTPIDVEPAKHDGRLNKNAYPVVVLVNGGSASASEIVSGAIKDTKAGTLVGTTTYGKGLVQTIMPVGEDAAVKITTQHYYTPAGTDINKKFDEKTGKQISGGVKPDIEVELTEKDGEAMRDALRANPLDRTAGDKLDPQLTKAVEVLKEKLAATTAKK